MVYPTTRNFKPRELEVGTYAYYVPDLNTVKLLDSVFSSAFESGRGYLVVIAEEPKWVDSTFFWSEREIKELVEASKK